MGVCAHRKDQEDQAKASLPPAVGRVTEARILQKLVDLRKSKNAPVITLANNPLYLKRLEVLKSTRALCHPAKVTEMESTDVRTPKTGF